MVSTVNKNQCFNSPRYTESTYDPCFPHQNYYSRKHKTMSQENTQVEAKGVS